MRRLLLLAIRRMDSDDQGSQRFGTDPRIAWMRLGRRIVSVENTALGTWKPLLTDMTEEKMLLYSLDVLMLRNYRRRRSELYSMLLHV